MAEISLPHFTLLPKELAALNNVLKLSFEAFKAGGYPPYFECFLSALLQIIQLGSAAIMHAAPKVSIHQFSLEIDELADFLREIKAIVAANVGMKIR